MKNLPINSRREFLNKTLLGGTALLTLGPGILQANDAKPVNTAHPLRILILGGTSFLGPHQIAYAMNRGHAITTFTRGKTKPTIHQRLFKNVEALIGDRKDNLEALRGKKWDAVIDNSGRRVQWTKDTAELLRDNVDLYVYTSSTGVYYPYLTADIKEDQTLVTVVPENLNEDQALEYGYGVMKTNSETAARTAFGVERTIIVRPTYMMGPADRTDRFTYWPVRLARGGNILVPGKQNDPVQYIDVRDVAGWMIRLIEQKKAGTFNAVGPASATGMHQFIFGAHAAFSSPANFIAVNDYDFLLQHQVPYAVPWIMPTGENWGSARVSNLKAGKNGLSYTPLAQSVHDIHEWWYSDAVEPERRERMENGEKSLMAREKEILTRWKTR